MLEATIGEDINFEMICGHINQSLSTHLTLVHVFFNLFQMFCF